MSKLLLKELKKRVRNKEQLDSTRKFNLEEHCFDKQLEFIKSEMRFKTAVCSRRSGKSSACVADLINMCYTIPSINTAYITLARTSAKNIIWPLFKQILREYKIPVRYDNSSLTIEFNNGSMIYVGGAKDESEIEKFRGMSYKKVYIDEAQAFRQTIISKLIEDIISPALWDVRGTLCLIGTPGPVPAGYFYDISHNPKWGNFTWTILDNPWIKIKSGVEPATLLAEERERKGITEADPTYRREALGEWVQDFNALVYKFSPLKNIYAHFDTSHVTYIMGIDIGFNDADAIAVMAYSAKDKTVYLVEEVVTRKQDITSLVEQINALKTKYEPVKMVMDAGALGKKIQEEIRTRHGIPVEAADKARKLEYIKLLNDDLHTGKFKAFKGSLFEEDSQLVVWDYDDPAKPRISDRYHTDIGDAVLYAWRECKHFFGSENDNIPKIGSDKYMDYLESKEAEEMENKLKGLEMDWGVDTEDLNDVFDEK